MSGMTVAKSFSPTIVSDKKAWDEYFLSLPAHLKDINFTFDYYNLYNLNGNGKPELFVIRENEELFFYPYLIRDIESDALKTGYQDIESAYGYSGPLSTTDDEGFLARCAESFNAYSAHNKVVTEFIRFHPLIHNEYFVQNDSTIKLIPLRDYVYVDLKKSLPELWDSYTSQNRNKIRKAEKNNVHVLKDDGLKHFDDFENIYLRNMEQLNAARLYFFSKEFFAGLKNLVEKNGFLLIAKQDTTVLGASVFLAGETYGHYFLSSASPDGKKLAVSNLLLHHGIQQCRNAGLDKLHLGGSVSDEPGDPLLVFKKNFSSLTTKFYIGKRIHLSDEYRKLSEEWDIKFAPSSEKYKNILQRYRLTEADLV
jgi:hypothetical protein